jgi:CBS domain-containing protein
MVATDKPLAEVTAAELMSRDPVVVPQHIPLQAAARMLSGARVSGAPVVDRSGACVGVLSAHDFMRVARQDEDARCRTAPCFCSDWQVVEADVLPADAVAGHMTADPVTMPPTATVGELARTMLDAHIHRVIVVDEARRPVGVVSSTDILAALARADDGR